jgi:hypothetical protein
MLALTKAVPGAAELVDHLYRLQRARRSLANFRAAFVRLLICSRPTACYRFISKALPFVAVPLQESGLSYRELGVRFHST